MPAIVPSRDLRGVRRHPGRGGVAFISALGGVLAGAPGCDTEPPGPVPVILVCLDTLRPDRLGVYGHEGALTPNLDRFARDAVVFESAYAQANETLFSHASLFSSRYPSELGSLTYNFQYPDDVPTLAEVLGHYGYHTAGSVAGGHLDPLFNLERGFDTWMVPEQWGSLYHTVPPALSWLDGLPEGEPFFLFVHGYDAHQRYLKPAPVGHAFVDPGYDGVAEILTQRELGVASIFEDHAFVASEIEALVDFREPVVYGPRTRSRLEAAARDPQYRVETLEPEDHAYIRDIYDGAVSYADTFFGLFLAGLEDRDLLQRSLVVVLSDHGESLGERGLYNHRYGLWDEDVATVLMVRPPGGIDGGLRVQDPVALLDVLPTVLDRVGARPPVGIQGRSLVPYLSGGAPGSAEGAAEAEPVFSEGVFRMVSVRSADHRLVFRGVSADSPFLPDLIRIAHLDGPSFEFDPEAAPEDRRRLREALLQWRDTVEPGPLRQEAVDPELLRELRERGYWGLQ